MAFADGIGLLALDWCQSVVEWHCSQPEIFRNLPGQGHSVSKSPVFLTVWGPEGHSVRKKLHSLTVWVISSVLARSLKFFGTFRARHSP